MSGPIVRKYGFPNFEKIFGERGLQHGADEETPKPPAATANEPAADASATAEPEIKKSKKGR